MKYAIVEGKKVTIGDWVSFKSDIEQCGKIIDIRNSNLLTLKNENGFIGGYIGGQTTTFASASDCWID